MCKLKGRNLHALLHLLMLFNFPFDRPHDCALGGGVNHVGIHFLRLPKAIRAAQCLIEVLERVGQPDKGDVVAMLEVKPESEYG